MLIESMDHRPKTQFFDLAFPIVHSYACGSVASMSRMPVKNTASC